jgi:hypothetical protein
MNNSMLLTQIADQRRRDFEVRATEGRLARLARCCRPAMLRMALAGLAARLRSRVASCCA